MALATPTSTSAPARYLPMEHIREVVSRVFPATVFADTSEYPLFLVRTAEWGEVSLEIANAAGQTITIKTYRAWGDGVVATTGLGAGVSLAVTNNSNSALRCSSNHSHLAEGVNFVNRPVPDYMLVTGTAAAQCTTGSLTIRSILAR